nr:hypothetical protein [Tanacetum cinerariifolium]
MAPATRSISISNVNDDSVDDNTGRYVDDALAGIRRTSTSRYRSNVATNASNPKPLLALPNITRTWNNKPNTTPLKKQLTQKEYEDKRAKNLCLYYDKKFVPGHKCREQLYSLVVLGENEEMKEEFVDVEDSLEEIRSEEMQPHISPNALHGMSSFEILRVVGLYADKHEDKFPIPVIDELIDELHGAVIFSKLDLRLTGYYRKFIKDFASLSRLLTQLLKKNSYKWSDEAQVSFLAIKEAMTKALVLALPNFTITFEVETDASGMGRGYLLDRHFIIKTYHYSLKYLLDQRITTPVKMKWLPKLMGFDYEVKYKKGVENVAIDALSRVQTDGHLMFAMVVSIPADFITRIEASWHKDDTLQPILSQLQSGQQAKKHYSFRGCYNIRLIKKLLYDNSSPRLPKEFVSANSDAEIKSFSPSPILVKDSDSLMEEIDLLCTMDYPMPPGIEDDDYDSERDILILKDLPSNNTLSFAKKESFHFDIPPFSCPPTKPPDGDTGILNIKMRGDIFDQKAFMHKLMITLASHQEISPDLLSH